MDYDVGNLLDRIKQLENRVQQLEVSPRTGLFNSEFATSTWGASSTIPDVPNTWQNFNTPGPTVTLQTGTRVLVMYGGRPTIQNTTNKYTLCATGFKITGATTRSSGTTDQTNDQAGAGTAAAAWERSTGLQVELVSGLNPGINTFTLQGYFSAPSGAGPAVLNDWYNRVICVIPLDI